MKRNVFILLIICLLSLVRVVEAQEVIESDTIYTTQEHAQPTDDKRRVVTNPFWDNWFLNAGPTVSYYIGDYHSDGSTGRRFSPGFYVSLGKWITPGFGLMAQFNGLQARGSSHETNPFTVGGPYTNSDGTIWYKSTMKFTDVSIQALINLNNVIWGYKPGRRHRVHLAGGFGWLHHYDMAYDQSNQYSGHIEVNYEYHFKPGWAFQTKLYVIGMETNFDDVFSDRHGHADVWDAMFGAGVGISYYFNKREWDRCNSCPQDIIYINKKINQIRADCPKTETGVLEFYVFYPNNYSGCNDAPTVADARVNSIDYLVSGIYTQKRFSDTDVVNSLLGNERALSDLETSDIATVNATQLDNNMFRGYEMSSTPLSRIMTAEEMQAFKDKEGYYYAPIYSEVTGNSGEMNKWGYRVDPSTAGQRLANKKENYDDVQSYQLNAHQGLKIVKEYTTEEDVPVTLCSLADFYAAVSGNTGYIRQFTDSAMVDKVNGILNGDNIVMIEVSGLATSQDNNKKQEVGVERNERLATDRATSVMNWMKQMDCFKDADNKFIMQKGSNLVKKVKDKSVNSLDSKLNRSARVRIIYTYTR